MVSHFPYDPKAEVPADREKVPSMVQVLDHLPRVPLTKPTTFEIRTA